MKRLILLQVKVAIKANKISKKLKISNIKTKSAI